ncbi:MAG: flippase [Gemmatimonadaceae bacterium]
MSSTFPARSLASRAPIGSSPGLRGAVVPHQLRIVLIDVRHSNSIRPSPPILDLPAGRKKGARRVARNFGLLLSAEVLAQLLGFVLLAYLARVLGADGFGLLTYATAVTTGVVSLQEAGTDSWGIREVSRDPGRLRIVLGAVLGARLSMAAVAGSALAVYAVHGVIAARAADAPHPMRAWALLFGCVSVAAGALQTSWAYRAMERVIPVAAANVIQRALAVGLVLGFVHSSTNAPRAVLLQGASELVVAVVLLLGLRHLVVGVGVRPAWDGALARRAVKEAWPMGASRMTRAGVVALTVGILAHTSTNATVGHYGAANRLVMALLTVSAVFSMAVMPSIVRACARGIGATQTVSAAQRLLIALYLPVVVGGVLLARPIMTWLFGVEFTSSALPLRLLILSLPFSALSDPLRSVLLALHRQADILRAVAGAATVTIVSGLVLCPRFGAEGASSAVLAGEVTLFALTWISVRRHGVQLPIVEPLLRPLVAVVVMATAVQLLGNHELVSIILASAVVYVAVLLAVGGVTVADLHALDTPKGATDVPSGETPRA